MIHTMYIPIDKIDIDLFLSFVDIGDNGSCCEWIGAKNRGGYGIFTVDCITYSAHRVMWSLVYQTQIDSNLFVLHSCDHPSCVNTDHLFLGTQKDNMYDCKHKNRNHVMYGINNPASVLSYREVECIRDLWSGGATLQCLSDSFGVTVGNIKNIVYGKTWNKNGDAAVVKHGSLRGSLNGRAKLTESQVRAIRKEYSSNSVTARQLAERYGVKLSSIHSIIYRETWKHI